MDLEFIGSAVTAPWGIQADSLRPGPVEIAFETSAPNGAVAFYTRWATATNGGAGFQDGPLRADPAIFGTDFTVCKKKIYYGVAPSTCLFQLALSVVCENGYADCTVPGQIGLDNVSIPLCWSVAPTSNAPFFLAQGLHTRISPARRCAPIVSSYATRVQVNVDGSAVVSFFAVRNEASAARSAVFSLVVAALLVVWVARPQTSKGVYKWLDADMAIIPPIINLSYLSRDTPIDCAMCDGHHAVCEWLCMTPISSYVWALSGMAIPVAVVATASRRWQSLHAYTMPAFCFYAIEVLLLATSAANFPVDQVRGNAETLLMFAVGTGLSVIVGKSAAFNRARRWPETILTATFSATTLGMAMGSFIRPAVQDHPSLVPSDAGRIAGICIAVASIATVAGVFGSAK